MIYFAIYLCAALSVLLAVWVVGATVRFVATAFKAGPEVSNKPPNP
jgi:hypothetical protein